MSDLETNSLADVLVTAIRDLRFGTSVAQRVRAVQSLASVRSQVAAGYLIDALSDDAPEVRATAVEALAELENPSALEPLRSLLERETNPNVDRAISDAIDQIETALAIKSAAGPAGGARPPAPRLDATSNTASARVDSALDQLGAEEACQRLEDVYRRAAEERQLLEQARRRSADETRRRLEEEQARLQAEEESLAHLSADLERRQTQIEQARLVAEEDAHRISALEEEVRVNEANRALVQQETIRLEAELRRQIELEREHADEIRREKTEHQRLAEEYERSLETLRQLHAEAE